MQEKNKINKNPLNDLWSMRTMTFKEMLNVISNHPDLKFLITTGGIWWLAKMILFITILFLIKSKKSFFELNIPERNINKSLVIYL